MELSVRRKSPRFSSAPAKSDATTAKRKQKRPKSDELALSLQVIEPVPLSIYDPSFSARKCYRISPRSTANKYRSSDNEDLGSVPLALPPIASIQGLRRSPRLVSPVSDCKYVNLSKSDDALKSKCKPEKRKATFCAPVEDSALRKCLRKFPRLSSNLGGELLALPEPMEVKEKRSSRKMGVASGNSEISGSERCLRSRTVTFCVGVKSDLVELPKMKTSVRNESNLGENGSSFVSEKCLRSRKIPFCVVGDEHVEKKPALSEFPIKEDKNMTGKGKMSGSDITSEKCLRLRKITTPVVGDEHVEKSALIERPGKDHKGMKVKTNSIGLDTTSEKCLRSRKITSPVVRDEHVEKNPGLIECPIKEHKGNPTRMKTKTSGSDISNKKCIRSREITTPVAGPEHIETKSGSSEWPTKERTGTSVKNNMSGLNITSEKCLRSRKRPYPVVVADHAETKFSLMEWSNKEHNRKPVNTKASASLEKKPKKKEVAAFFVGEPIPDEEARERWSWRYELKGKRREGQGWILNADEEDEIILNVECHYRQAKVDGCIFSIGDCAFIRGEGREKHVGRILEFFKTTEGKDFFRIQWFYKAEDTVMKDMASFHDKRRLFFSSFMNDNLLDCIVSKVNVIEKARGLGLQTNSIHPSDFYYDMEYCVEYSTFRTLPTDNYVMSRGLPSLNYTDTFRTNASTPSLDDLSSYEPHKAELALLDLYSGCGGMSTGLCLGAKLSNVNLVTRWAVDYNKAACESLKLNHPETQVRNMPAEDFLELLKGWEKLCKLYALNGFEVPLQSRSNDTAESRICTNSHCDVKMPRGEFEVLFLVDITYGSIGKSGKHGLKFKVRWKGYDPSEDTWEPIEGLSNCQDHLRDFVRSGSKSKILPMPGDVGVICGGPPCQGISGYNRFRNIDDPLTDERNRQIVVFMDIVKFLKPKYVLMENVADILRFDKASLGRYALSRMVHMKYQTRLGTMAAGCYGLPQFRLRVFIWGALPSEKLPQFPLPTHDVVVRYWPSPEFEQNTVAYDEGQPRELEEAVILRDAISDLPPVTSHETREEMTYAMPPETEFQKYIRLTKHEIMGFASRGAAETESSVLYDHRPYTLSEDDYLRVCQIPHKKGANFRDFPGVVVDKDNSVVRDPTKEPIMLPSGKPLVPDYVFTFGKGKSKRPFARLWWDETVATIVTFPSCHNQAALHPEQDRVLTLREYARLQGFPDFYRFCGTVKERYCQVGNAVAVPVARALGYALGMAFRKLGGDGPVLTLPPKFSSQIPERAENFE